ncbi:MAG: ABC transporter ATP-binding protein [Akkermansia sp.]
MTAKKDTDTSKAGPAILPIARRYSKGCRGLLIIGIIAGVISAITAGFGLPFMLKEVFPIVFAPDQAPPALIAQLQQFIAPQHLEKSLLWGAALLLPITMFLRGSAGFLNSYLLTCAGMKVLTALRIDIFAKYQTLPFSYHDKHQRGEMMTIVIQYTQMLQTAMINIVNDLVLQSLTLIAAISYLVYAAMQSEQNAMLLGSLGISSLCIPIVRFVGRSIVRHIQASMSGLTKITSCLEESFSAQREVRAFNLQQRQETLLLALITALNKVQLKLAIWQQGLSPAIEVVSALALSFTLYQGCSSGLTLDEFAGIAAAFYYCYDPIKRLGAVSNQYSLMKNLLGGITSILEAKNDNPEPTNPQSLGEHPKGDVDFNHVIFGYNNRKTVLKDIDIHVPAGQIVALVGPSGSGKTSFINLINRFYDTNEGSICIDGIDVRQITRAERTSNIALVSQFPALFHGSLRDNIHIGRPEASDEEVIAAAQLAGVNQFIHEHEDGYDRKLDEGGSGLSGGQRQRVSIARAFLKKAPILILDEATSALDMRSEALIQESLEMLAKRQTTFIIAHRFSTIRMAQRILVFNDGQIIGDGTHAELYESTPLYRRLYDEQVTRTKEKQSPTTTTPEPSLA